MNDYFPMVCDFPVQKKYGQLPKYRLIYGTRHEDGMLLMNDTMYKARKQFLKQEFADGLLTVYQKYLSHWVTIVYTIWSTIGGYDYEIYKRTRFARQVGTGMEGTSRRKRTDHHQQRAAYRYPCRYQRDQS
jgi:hypothetical protein